MHVQNLAGRKSRNNDNRTIVNAPGTKKSRNGYHSAGPNASDAALLNDIFLQPWFLPRQTALAIRRLIPDSYHRKMRYYFEDYGCLRCSRNDVLHMSNGLCEKCKVEVCRRLLSCLNRRWKEEIAKPEAAPSHNAIGTRMTEARRLLRDMVPVRRNKQLA